MKNAKIVKVCKIVIQVCNIATIIAQTLIKAFPVTEKELANYPVANDADLKLIKEFLASQKMEDFKDDSNK